MKSPLDGIRVLEFGHVAAGPFVGMVLADLGADVVKIEPPAGDHMRRWPPFVELADGTEFSLNFASINRGKRSVSANLKDAVERDGIIELAKSADVIIENYRPGVLSKFGLGFDDIAEASSSEIVYCSLSGYGQTGPYRDRGAFDVVVQAEAGLMSVTGEPDGPPIKCGVPVGDFVPGLYASVSILAGLETRRREKRSVHIDCPMISSLLAVSALQTSQYWGTGRSPLPLGSSHPRNAPYQAFQAADRPFVLAAGTDSLWQEVARAVGLEELIEDPRFASQSMRADHQKELAVVLQERFSMRTAEEWLKELRERGVPSGPVNTYADILADPHVAEIGLIQSMFLPDGSSTPTIRFPASMPGIAPTSAKAAPALGHDTKDVFEDWLP